MRKISTVLCLVAIAGVAHAGDDPAAKKTAPAPAAKKAPPPDTAMKPPEPKPEAPPAPPAMPDPPQALLDVGKALAGTWRCKGTDGMKATLKYKLDLDKLAIRGDVTVPKQKGQKRGYKDVSYRVFSPTDSKWYVVGVDNMGSIAKGWSTGADATGKVTWESEGVMMGQAMKSRSYEEPVAGKKKAMHVWGEVSGDGGKTWTKTYDATCTK